MQPPIASLVKYDNSVLVSSSKDKKGKGTPGKKVSWRKSNFDVRRHLSFCASFARFPSYISFCIYYNCRDLCLQLSKSLAWHKQKISSTPFSHQGDCHKSSYIYLHDCKNDFVYVGTGNGQRRGSFGFNMCRAHQQHASMLSTFRKSSTSSFSSVRSVWNNLINFDHATYFSCMWPCHVIMSDMQARETGICPVREELYAQCFDELIRQVTINCAERGLLLLRVRDEMRMTVAAYQVGDLRSLNKHYLSVFFLNQSDFPLNIARL